MRITLSVRLSDLFESVQMEKRLFGFASSLGGLTALLLELKHEKKREK